MRYRLARQLNVQQQNSLMEEAVRSSAVRWRRHGVPQALRVVGQERGVLWERSIVVELDIDFPGMPQLFGLLLTQHERFIHFEIETDEQHCVAEAVACWIDVTSEQNLNPRNRGTGAGKGALAIKVRRDLDA
jgi:hypothetical protein